MGAYNIRAPRPLAIFGDDCCIRCGLIVTTSFREGLLSCSWVDLLSGADGAGASERLTPHHAPAVDMREKAAFAPSRELAPLRVIR